MKFIHILFTAAFTLCIMQSCKDANAEVAPAVEASATNVSNVIKNAPKPTARVQSSSGEKMKWASMDQVEAKVKKEKKKILVDVYTKWCGPCKMMDSRTFSVPEVQKAIDEKFHAVKFDAEGAAPIKFQGKTWANPKYDPNKRGRNARHELSSFFSVRGYPCLVILDENFKVVKKITGFRTAEQLLAEIATI